MVLARGLHFPRVVEASYFSHSGRASATVYKLNRIVDSIIYAYTASVIHRRTPQPTSDTLRLVYTAGMLIQLLALSTAHIFPRTLVLYHEAIKVFVQTCSFFTLYVSHTLIVSCKHRSVFPLVLIAMMPGWNFLPGQVRVSTFGPVLVLQLFAWLPLDAWSREKLIIYFDFPKQGLADRLMRAATLFLLCQVVPMLVGSWLEVKARRAYLASHHPTMEWTPTGPWAAILRLLRMRVGQAGVPENEPSLSGTHALLHSRGKMEASGDYAAAGPSVAAKSIQTEVEVERQVHARLQRDFERSQQELQVAQRREEQLVAANACLGRQLEALTGIKQVLSLRQAAIQDQVASLVQDRMYMRAENLALQQKLAEVSSQASDSAAALSTVLRELQHLQATAAGERRGVWHSVLTALGLDPASLEAPSADQQERIEQYATTEAGHRFADYIRDCSTEHSQRMAALPADRFAPSAAAEPAASAAVPGFAPFAAAAAQQLWTSSRGTIYSRLAPEPSQPLEGLEARCERSGSGSMPQPQHAAAGAQLGHHSSIHQFGQGSESREPANGVSQRGVPSAASGHSLDPCSRSSSMHRTQSAALVTRSEVQHGSSGLLQEAQPARPHAGAVHAGRSSSCQLLPSVRPDLLLGMQRSHSGPAPDVNPLVHQSRAAGVRKHLANRWPGMGSSGAHPSWAAPSVPSGAAIASTAAAAAGAPSSSHRQGLTSGVVRHHQHTRSADSVLNMHHQRLGSAPVSPLRQPASQPPPRKLASAPETPLPQRQHSLGLSSVHDDGWSEAGSSPGKGPSSPPPPPPFSAARLSTNTAPGRQRTADQPSTSGNPNLLHSLGYATCSRSASDAESSLTAGSSILASHADGWAGRDLPCSDSGESGSSGDEAGSTSESGSGGRSRQGGRGNGAAVDQASSSPEIAAREWADLWALKCRQEQQWGEALWRCHQQLTTHLRRFAQVFQQTGQADKDLAAVRARHEAHQNAERDVLEARAVAATAGRDATRDAALLSISALIAQQQELRAVLRDARWLLQAAFPSRVLDSLNLTPLTRHCMGPDVHGVVDAEMVAWLQQLGVPAELVTGGQSLPSQQWLERLQQWLASHCLQEATSGSCSDPGQQTAQLCVAFETLLQGALKHCQRAVFSAAQDSAQVLARLTALQASHAELQHMQQVDQHILDIMRQDRQALLTEIAVVQQCLDMSICNVCMGPMTANSRATSSAA